VPRDARVLHIGCGTSALARDLYHEGRTNIVNIDVSERAIELAIRAAARDTRGTMEMEFRLADCRDMRDLFPAASFSVAIDKGTLDSISCDKEVGDDNVARMLAEVRRVLAPGGLFLFVTTVDSAGVARFLASSRFEVVSVTHLVTKMSQRRVPVMPNDVYVLRKAADEVLDLGGGADGVESKGVGVPVGASAVADTRARLGATDRKGAGDGSGSEATDSDAAASDETDTDDDESDDDDGDEMDSDTDRDEGKDSGPDGGATTGGGADDMGANADDDSAPLLGGAGGAGGASGSGRRGASRGAGDTESKGQESARRRPPR